MPAAPQSALRHGATSVRLSMMTASTPRRRNSIAGISPTGPPPTSRPRFPCHPLMNLSMALAV
jgi:hypothetical protein